MSLSTNHLKYPSSGFFGRLVTRLANSQRLASARRAITGRLPFPVLRSDVRDVVYMTWMVDANRVAHLAPRDLELWQVNGQTPFTILTYRHGNFGPSMLGPFRRLAGSPIQSNWRLYLRGTTEAGVPERTVLFIKNIMNSRLYTIGSRLFSDALATHLAARLDYETTSIGFDINIESGEGSSPALSAQYEHQDGLEGPNRVVSAFGDWKGAIDFLICQDAAVLPLPAEGRLAFSRISLPVDLDAVTPLKLNETSFACPVVDSLEPSSDVLCFYLPSVTFRALSEACI